MKPTLLQNFLKGLLHLECKKGLSLSDQYIRFSSALESLGCVGHEALTSLALFRKLVSFRDLWRRSMNFSRSMSSSNSARRDPRSRRRKVISASSAPSTENRMESRALGSTKCVGRWFLGWEWNVLDRAPELVRQSRSFGFQIVLMAIRRSLVSVYMRQLGGFPPRGDRGRKTVTLS